MSKIGLQLYSLREETEKDFLGAIQKMADLGYEGVQFAGFYDTPASEVKRTLDDNRLVSAGAHIGFSQLLGEEWPKTFDFQHGIGNNLIICPAIPEDKRQSADDYKRIAEAFNTIGQTCKGEGFVFGYHNHDFEFTRFGDKTGFDLLFEHTDPDLVKMELDCYWAESANWATVEIIHKYQERIVSLHIKDMKMEDGHKKGTEVGYGKLDFEAIMRAAEEYGISWLIVEQEEFERNPYESLSINLENLQRIKSKVERQE